jgi:hypothetical protein
MADSDGAELYNLNCWIFGDNSKQDFAIQIRKTETVGMLKKKIVNSQVRFRGIDAPLFDLWQVSIPAGREQAAGLNAIKLEATSNEPRLVSERDPICELWPTSPLQEVFRLAPDHHFIHIVVQPPSGSCSLYHHFADTDGFLTGRQQNIFSSNASSPVKKRRLELPSLSGATHNPALQSCVVRFRPSIFKFIFES